MAKTKNHTKEREEWLALVRKLCDDIKSWAEEEHWFVHEDHKTIRGEKIGEYEVPVLLIRAGAGRISVEPIGREIVGADGRVDIGAFPTFDRMVLVRTKGKWVLETDHCEVWPVPWSREAFLEVVETLAAAR